MQQTSTNAWNRAIGQIRDREPDVDRLDRLFKSWAELDDEEEQKQTLKIIESLESVSIE